MTHFIPHSIFKVYRLRLHSTTRSKLSTMDDPLDLQPLLKYSANLEDFIPPTLLSHVQQPHSNPCHFVRQLPLELRNAIYKLLLGKLEYTSSYVRYYMPRNARAGFAIPAIARTCKQVRHEVLSLFLGNQTVRVELRDEIDLDAVYLERCLQDLGGGIMLIGQLEIQHKVDFFFQTRKSNTGIVWATTTFRVDDNGSVEIYCDFGTPQNIGDEIPAGTVCRCPLTKRMEQARQLPSEGCSGNVLTRAVSNFQEVMDVEAAGCRPTPYYTRHPTLEWPHCSDCGGHIWYLRGPVTLSGRAYNGLRENEIFYKGFKWLVCPEEIAYELRDAPSSRQIWARA